jgi:hypothetical protein
LSEQDQNSAEHEQGAPEQEENPAAQEESPPDQGGSVPEEQEHAQPRPALFAAGQDDWSEIVDDEESAEATVLQARLRQLLSAERLLVFAGLGTSMCIQSNDQPAPSMSDLWDRAKKRVGEEAWKTALEATAWDTTLPDDIELLMSRAQMARALGKGATLEDFILNCENEIVTACRFVKGDSDLPVHETFLRRIARRPTRLPRTQIYTTNYDLAFETAASRTGFAVVDGFSHTTPQRFDNAYFDVDFAVRDRERAATPVEWMPSVMHLLKLHGSVDWARSGDGVIRDPEAAHPLIIYPRSSKFEVSYQHPFLDLMARFQAAIRKPDTALLVVGSGLRDDHIVQPILAAARANIRLSLVLVGPSLAATNDTAVQELTRYVRAGDRRITFVAASFEQLVGQLPDLVPETEAEQHDRRISS